MEDLHLAKAALGGYIHTVQFYLIAMLAFPVFAAEPDLQMKMLPKGWLVADSGVRVLRAKGPRAQKFQAARGNRTNKSDLRKEAEARWEEFFITELPTGDPVFLKKNAAASGHLEGLLLCRQRRYELKGRISSNAVLLSLLASLRCGVKIAVGKEGPLIVSQPPAASPAARPNMKARLGSYLISDLLAEPSGESLLGKSREEVIALRPYLRLRNYWNLGPMRIEELREFVENPIPGTRNYVFEGWGEPKLVRVIFEFKPEPTEQLVGRISKATSKSLGDAAKLRKPYTLALEDVDNGTLARLKRLGRDFEEYAKADKKIVDGKTVLQLFFPFSPPDVLVWKTNESAMWLGDGEAGMGTPELRSAVFMRETYHLALLFGIFTFVLWLLLFWTPLLDNMPNVIQKTAKGIMGFASTVLWVLYPLGTFGWFFFEIRRAGYL